MIGWNELIDLTFNSIQIAGIFIAIIIGLVISKAMEMKQESGELLDALEDVRCEINNDKQYLNKLKKENEEYYKYSYAEDVTLAILNGKASALFDVPYVDTKEQLKFCEYVKSYIGRIWSDVDSELDSDTCKQNNSVTPGSVEEVIIDATYEWYEDNCMRKEVLDANSYSSLLGIPQPTISLPKLYITHVPSTSETMRSNAIVHEMDKISYEISARERQCALYLRRIKSINNSSNMRYGLAVSLAVVIFSVVIPFLIVAFQNYLIDYNLAVYIYVTISFIISMIVMCIYLFYFCTNRGEYKCKCATSQD